MPLTILFEDPHLVVVDKPAGLVVHPAAGHGRGTLVNGLLHHCKDLSGIGGALRPGIVHRLDKDTSGVLVVAKSAPTHVALAQLFHDKNLKREYTAVVAPPLTAPQGTFNTWFGRHPTDRKRFSSKVRRGKRAVTHYTVEQTYAAGASRVRARLDTGRTHQIRVHFADAGHPVMGDPVYGKKLSNSLAAFARELNRQALHAHLLEFVHPITKEPLSFKSPLPPDLQKLLDRLANWP
jgi:23S rRNA pseudouridine1911/1915/1917 synthase